VGILAQQGQSELAQGGEVVGRLVFAHSAIVLAEGDIEHPMQTVLDAPVVRAAWAKDSALVMPWLPM
jgi:hypothetical protein